METIVKSDETQEILTKVAHVTNEAHKGKVVNPATRFSTKRERDELHKELKQIESVLEAPTWVTQDSLTPRLQEELYARREDLQEQIETVTPPKLSGNAKDALTKRLSELEADIGAAMQPEEVMWRNPTGSVDRYRRGEGSTTIKNKILERRNILIALEPESDDVEFTSTELLRPTLANRGDAATFMANAQLPGHFAMSPLAKANWPLGEPKVDTPLKQAERREAEEAAEPEKPKRSYHKNQGRTETEEGE